MKKRETRFKRMQKLEGHTSDVMKLVFSPDGCRIASAQFNMLLIWETDRQGRLHPLQKIDPHTLINPFAFSPDWRRLVSRHDESLMVWEADRQGRFQLVQKLKLRFLSRVFAVAFSPDGCQLVSVEEDALEENAVLVWETDRQGEFQQVQKLEERIHGDTALIAFSPRGCLIAMYNSDGAPCEIQMLEIRQGRLQEVQRIKCGGRVFYVFLSPDGRRLVFAVGNEVQIWETDSQGQFQQFHKLEAGHNVTELTLSPDGSQLAYSGRETIHIWEKDSQERLQQVQELEVDFDKDGRKGARERICSLAFSPDGRRLASGCLTTIGGLGNPVGIWESDE
jgi:WD40 repeat protein